MIDPKNKPVPEGTPEDFVSADIGGTPIESLNGDTPVVDEADGFSLDEQPEEEPDAPKTDPTDEGFALEPMSGPQMTPAGMMEFSKKFHMALGEESPGAEEVRAFLSGNRESLEESAANREGIRMHETAQKVIMQNVKQGFSPVNAEEVKLLAGTNFKPDTTAILEKKYAEKFVSTVDDMSHPEDFMDDHFVPTETKAVINAQAEDIIAKQEVVKQLASEVEEMKNQQSLTGKIIDFGLNLSDIYRLWKTHNQYGNKVDGSLLPGRDWLEQINWLYRQTPEVFKEELSREVRRIAADNPQLAKEYLDAVVGWTSNDATLQNALFGVNIATAATPGLVYKGAKAAIRAIRTPSEVRDFIKTVDNLSAADVAALTEKAGGKKLVDDTISFIDSLSKADVAKFSVNAPQHNQHMLEFMFHQWAKNKDRLVDYAKNLPEKEREVLRQRIRDFSKFVKGLSPEDSAKIQARIENFGHKVEETADFLRKLSPDAVLKLKAGSLVKSIPKDIDWSAIPKRSTTQEATAGVKEAVKANGRIGTDTVDVLTSAGRPDMAAKLTIAGDIAKLGDNPKVIDVKKVFVGGTPIDINNGTNKIFKMANPSANLVDTSGRFSAEFTRKLSDQMYHIIDEVSNVVKTGARATRLTTEQLQKAFEVAEQNMKSFYKYPEDHIVDVAHITPDETFTNTGFVKVALGEADGNGFESIQAARAGARKLSLPHGSYTIDQIGNKHYLGITAPLDEDNPAVKKALLDSQRGKTPLPGVVRGALNWLTGAADRISPFQRGNRQAVISSRAKMDDALRQLGEPLVNLSNDSKRAIGKVMEHDMRQTRVDAEGKAYRGIYQQSLEEFSTTFESLNKRYPTEKEAEAYFLSVLSKDMDYVINNVGKYRDALRQGLHELVLTVPMESKEGKTFLGELKGIHAKPVDGIPWEDTEQVGIILHRKDGTMTHIWKNDPEAKKVIEEMTNAGAKIFQVGDPNGLSSAAALSKRVEGKQSNFIVSQNFGVGNLNWQQTPYREGWHVAYGQGSYVKQANIEKAIDANGNVIHQYKGDTAFLGFNTNAEAVKYAKKFEDFRKLYLEYKAGNATVKQLRDFAGDNLPISAGKMMGYFEDIIPETGKTRFDPNLPFMKTSAGKNIGDEHTQYMRDNYSNFTDGVRSKYNLVQNIDKKWSGSRDEPLLTVREGSEVNPIAGRIDEAKTIDPQQTIVDAMNSMARNYAFNDYKQSHVQHWITEFGDLVQNATENELLANPVYYLHEGSLKTIPGQEARTAAAQGSRRALLELLGTRTADQKAYDWMMTKTLDEIYKKKGQKGVERFMAAETYTPNITRAMRSTVMHLSVGLFNVAQTVMNSMMFTQAIAINPRWGASGSFSALLSRMVLQNPKLEDKLFDFAKGWGVSPEVLRESHKELKAYGKEIIEGTHAFTDDIREGLPFVGGAKGKLQKALDIGMAPFKYGESFARATAWHTAFMEWRAANPKAKLTNEIRNTIAARADDMNGNMTNAGNAAWQKGALAVPTQFMSFSARLAELMLGTRLTKAEKTRLIAMNTAIGGVPIGLLGAQGIGALTLGQADLPGWAKSAAVEAGLVDPIRNIETKEKRDLFQTWLMDGMLGVLASSITDGDPTDIASRLTPAAGGRFIDKLFDNKEASFWMFLGPSGSTITNVSKTISPFWYAATSWLREGEFPLTNKDFLDVLKLSKGVNNALEGYKVFNTGAAISKNGLSIASDISPAVGFMQALAGVRSGIADESYQFAKYNKSRTDMFKDFTKEALPDIRLWCHPETPASERETAGKRLAARVGAYALTPQEKEKVCGLILENMTLEESAKQKWLQTQESKRNRNLGRDNGEFNPQ